MAHELGISKKTLVGIEKGRSSLGWTGSAALCLLFGDSETLRRGLSCDPARAAAALRLHSPPAGISSDTGIASPPPAEGSSPLWRAVGQLGRFRAEQNVISEHYRLVDGSGRRVFASFDYSEITAVAERLETRGVQTKGDNGNDDEL